ncbi:MAG: hypothetical protein KJ749_05830, partial [Planctomycetes bacterium]|nr:hypothetical protein [Planctomycetota bacterium]
MMVPPNLYPGSRATKWRLTVGQSTTTAVRAQGRLSLGLGLEEAVELGTAVPDPTGVFRCPELPLCLPVIERSNRRIRGVYAGYVEAEILRGFDRCQKAINRERTRRPAVVRSRWGFLH